MKKGLLVFLLGIFLLSLTACSALSDSDEILHDTPADFSEYSSVNEFHKYVNTLERVNDYNGLYNLKKYYVMKHVPELYSLHRIYASEDDIRFVYLEEKYLANPDVAVKAMNEKKGIEFFSPRNDDVSLDNYIKKKDTEEIASGIYLTEQKDVYTLVWEYDGDILKIVIPADKKEELINPETILEFCTVKTVLIER